MSEPNLSNRPWIVFTQDNKGNLVENRFHEREHARTFRNNMVMDDGIHRPIWYERMHLEQVE